MQIRLFFMLLFVFTVTAVSGVEVFGTLKIAHQSASVVTEYNVFLTLSNGKQVKYLGPISFTKAERGMYQNEYRFKNLSALQNYQLLVRIYPKNDQSQYFSKTFNLNAEKWQTMLNAGEITVAKTGSGNHDFKVTRKGIVMPSKK